MRRGFSGGLIGPIRPIGPMIEKPATATCHLCGKEADIVLDGIGWCAGCWHAKGSCCGESEMEDCGE